MIIYRKTSWRLSSALGLLVTLAGLRCASAANVMNYGADGNDYYRFTVPSLAFDKASGFTTLITFAMHVNPDGTLLIGGDVACTNGVYTGPTNWNSLIATLKSSPTTVTRYEVCIGGYTDTSYDNIKSIVASQGTGFGSILYKNFQALKNAVPGIDAINDDDEQTYDLNSSKSFANMLGGLGYKFTFAPYTAQSFWVNLRNAITNCDYIYLQCYAGGAGNDPGQWNAAFGGGVIVIPGQESNSANPATFHNWHLETGVQGGFYYPDVVFNSTYWSAAVFEACGDIPPTPAGVAATPGARQVILTWNTAPGATSYHVKRSTSSGGETIVATVSAITNNWPASNEYTDTGLASGTTYYYKVSAVNTNGESLNSIEVSVTPQAGIINNPSFEFDATSPGTTAAAVPAGWAAFNQGSTGNIGSQNAGGIDYTINNPLANPASGNQYCYINMFKPGVTGGIYQDVGTLQANTSYTLTVAIGSRNDRINSAGIISLLNGANNSGALLVRGGSLPGRQNMWQDYSVTFATGSPVSGDLVVALSVLGSGTTIQADFDNVRLIKTPLVFIAPTLAAPTVSGGNLILQGTGGTPNAGYTWLTTTNFSTPINWKTNSTGALDAMGSFSNSLPIDPTAPANFFRLRMP